MSMLTKSYQCDLIMIRLAVAGRPSHLRTTNNAPCVRFRQDQDLGDGPNWRLAQLSRLSHRTGLWSDVVFPPGQRFKLTTVGPEEAYQLEKRHVYHITCSLKTRGQQDSTQKQRSRKKMKSAIAINHNFFINDHQILSRHKAKWYCSLTKEKAKEMVHWNCSKKTSSWMQRLNSKHSKILQTDA